MSIRHNWRKRGAAAPLYLEIVDHDTKRFAIEGPVTNDDAWIVEIYRARKAGRRLDFSLVGKDDIETHQSGMNNLADYERWPSSLIITPC